jgi:hypothetical protein
MNVHPASEPAPAYIEDCIYYRTLPDGFYVAVIPMGFNVRLVRR